MGTRTVYVCDYCGREEDEAEAVNWLQVEVVGVVLQTLGSPVVAGLFCGREHLRAVLNGEQPESGGG